MQKKQLKDWFAVPKQEKETRVFVQAKIKRDLYRQVKSIMDHNGFDWAQVLNACLSTFVEEMESVKKVVR